MYLHLKHLDPFVPNVAFLYSLKTSDHFKNLEYFTLENVAF